jgi:hypothetical protein
VCASFPQSFCRFHNLGIFLGITVCMYLYFKCILHVCSTKGGNEFAFAEIIIRAAKVVFPLVYIRTYNIIWIVHIYLIYVLCSIRGLLYNLVEIRYSFIKPRSHNLSTKYLSNANNRMQVI